MSNYDRCLGKSRPFGPGAIAGAGAGFDSGFDSGSCYGLALVDCGLGAPAVVRLRGVVG